MTDIHGLKPDVWPNTPYNVTAQIRGDIRQIVQREIEQVTIGTIGAETPAGAQAKVDTSAASLTAAIAAAKAELLAADALLAPLAHTHDDRYYLKSQVEAALSGKAAAIHTHHDLYYVKSEIDALLVGIGAVHNHNDLYYLKSEISAFLSGKAAAVHSHDDRYFTESEVNSLLAGKAAAVHSHNDLYYTEAEVDALIAGVPGGAGWTPVAASTSVQGIVELATVAETTAGTDGSRAATPSGLRAALDARGLLYAPALGADDNYVTDAEKLALHSHANKTALDAVSGTNTGDQDLSGYSLTTHDHAGVYASVSHTHAASQISDSTTTGRALITAATATAARTAISAAPALGNDDNYVTDAEKLALHSHANKTALDAVSGTNTGDQDLSGYATITQTINAQTGTTYTIAATDANDMVTLDNTAAITVTVPAGVIPAGQSVDVVVLNTGMATLVGSGGMVLQPEDGLSLTSRAQYSVFTILALSTTLAVVTGSLAAA